MHGRVTEISSILTDKCMDPKKWTWDLIPRIGSLTSSVRFVEMTIWTHLILVWKLDHIVE